LFGKLANISIESEAKGLIHDANFKSIVTGDTITADRKYAHPFDFEPYSRLIFAMNSLPRVDDKSDAYFRRLIILRFLRQFTEEEQDKQLKVRLIQEYDGILLWMLEGLKRLEKRGYFQEDEGVLYEINEYRKENNNVLLFVEEMCVVGGINDASDDTFKEIIKNGHDVTGMILKGTLYKYYKSWCQENGYKSLSDKKFGKELLRNFKKVREYRTGSQRFWNGIQLME